MYRFLKVTVILVFLLLVSTSSVTASSPYSVRIPQSAAEWASFSQAEKDRTMAWVWAQAKRLHLDETRPPELVQVNGNTKTRILATSVANGGVTCGITVQRYSWGKYSNAWAQAYAYQNMYAIDTGITNNSYGYWDTFTRNGRYVHSFGTKNGGTSAYAQSIQDFAFPWEALTYSIQAYGSAQIYSNYFAYKLVPCFKAQGV